MKSWKIIVAVVGACALIFGLFYAILCPIPFLEFKAGYIDVLRHELPKRVKIVNESFNAFGRDRSKYDYIALLQGDPDALISYTKLIGLNDRPFPENPHANHILSVKVKWWKPPLLTKGSGSRFFERKDSDHSITQAELAGNELYLFKVGDIDALTAQMKRNADEYKRK